MIDLVPLFTLHVDLADAQTIDGPYGSRRVIRVLGGRFTGDRIEGEILPGGADFQLVRPDGVAEIDVRAMLRTSTGSLIFLTGKGLRHGPPEVLKAVQSGADVDPADYYFRETLYFETEAQDLAWLNRVVTVARGARRANSAVIDVFEVL